MKNINFYKQTGIALLLSLGMSASNYGQSRDCRGGCEVNDLVVQNGYLLTVADKYNFGEKELFGTAGMGVLLSHISSRSIVIVSAPANSELSLAYTNAKDTTYTQTIKIPSVIYDTLGLGALIAPFMANATCEWYLEGVELPEGTGWTLIPKYTGKYKAVVTWSATPTTNLRTEAIYTTTHVFDVKKLVVPTGLSESSFDNTSSIFPNPVSESLWIQENEHFQYTLSDMQGNTTLSGEGNEKVQLNVQGLVRGIYLMEVTTNARTLRKKVVVK